MFISTAPAASPSAIGGSSRYNTYHGPGVCLHIWRDIEYWRVIQRHTNSEPSLTPPSNRLMISNEGIHLYNRWKLPPIRTADLSSPHSTDKPNDTLTRDSNWLSVYFSASSSDLEVATNRNVFLSQSSPCFQTSVIMIYYTLLPSLFQC